VRFRFRCLAVDALAHGLDALPDYRTKAPAADIAHPQPTTSFPSCPPLELPPTPHRDQRHRPHVVRRLHPLPPGRLRFPAALCRPVLNRADGDASKASARA
jgi:hypothetical protein